MRRITTLAVLLLAPLLGAAAEPGVTPPDLAAAGWSVGAWRGMPQALFAALPGGGIRVRGQAAGGFVRRALSGPGQCLSWRWRVDAGPPATALNRRGGDDRALAISVGFAGWPTFSSLWQRTQQNFAQAAAGDYVLPRSMLIYTWGGTGQEPRPFPSPYLAGLGQVRVLQPAAAPRGVWMEQRVDLAGDWRATFGGDPPPMLELSISADTDDTASALDAMVERIRFGPC
ncbi:MAG TPA: DUF3047 domain-containing protein [Roseomonas sp.]|jgi:hypothetical protein